MTLTQQDPMGNKHYTLPDAEQGTNAALTKSPFVLSRCYLHLVEKPEENRTVLLAKIQEVKDSLPLLGEYDQRQSSADIVYLQAILDGAEPNIAQILATTAYGTMGH
ncbi:hypothetical protein I350_05442 [Cryptococcus amylolentus CBS 6273]|uniref:Uncharacterized protein n=1 Tax=Cryptococcus amylolentus CBS 6273 TaxID=1296118 RepID=A0A1E3JY48_9TREE|nr:hypothetical protein I350_05442 [Cryptococcus amylolentus CBS 6273]